MLRSARLDGASNEVWGEREEASPGLTVDPIAVAQLQAISDSRPEVSGALKEMQVATLKLALMLPRSMLEQLVEMVIEWLNEVDGDPDIELIDEREPEQEG
jgi:hypothetical protein